MKKARKLFSGFLLMLVLILSMALFISCPESDDGDPDPETTYTETTLLTANGTVPIATFTDAIEGSHVVLTFTNDSGESRDGWGIGGIGNSFSDLEILSITPASFPAGATLTEQVTVATIIANSTQADVYFNIYNGCTLNTVVLFEPE